MRIIDYLRPSAVIANLSGSTADDVLAELCRPLASTGFDPNHLFEALLERERLSSTGNGDGVAIPHCKVHGLTELTLSFGRSKAGVDFSAVDGQPIRTNRLPFVQSRASAPLILTSLGIMAVGVWLPFSPFAAALGFATLPGLYWPLLLATLFLYVLLTQAVKMWLLKKAWI